MKLDLWTKVESIVHDALSDEKRPQFTIGNGSEDPDLECEVTPLLLSDTRATSIKISALKFEAQPLLQQDGAHARFYGPYEAVRELGRGGMATVYLGARSDGKFERTVALKVLPFTLNEILQNRFRSERQILARLEHPCIARLYESGRSSRGELFLAMEYVDGLPIDVYCFRNCLTLDQRLALFGQICGAVAEAHRNLVIHRDLKPSNILVTSEGVPKLLDFGIAKLLEPDSTQLALTQPGARPMTVSYASPEQLQGKALTTATDVYSLGVLLYRLLTGRRPHPKSLAERMEGLLAQQDPPRPSVKVLLACSDEETQPVSSTESRKITSCASARKLSRQLRGDLDAIVMKALRRDPVERYPSVQSMIEDLQCLANKEPVQARQGTLAYRAARFERRNRLAVAAVLIFGLLTAGWIGTLTAQKQRIAKEKDKAQDVAEFLVDLFEVTSPEIAHSRSIEARELLDLGVKRLTVEFGDEPELQATLLDTLGLLQYKLGKFEEASRLIERGRNLRLNFLGPEHPEYADSLHHLAQVVLDRGELEQAESLAQEVLAIRQRRFAENTPKMAASYSLLATLAIARADLKTAERLQRRVLSIRQAVFGSEHREVAAALGFLGQTLTTQGRFAEAEPLLNQAIEIQRQVLGDRHPDFANSLDRLARWHQAQGDHRVAEALFRQALDVRRGFFPELHQLVAKNLSDIGQCLWAQNKFEEAEAFHRQAIGLSRELWNGDHPQLAVQLNDLAVALSDRGELDEAVVVARESLEVAERWLGPLHPKVLTTRHNLASFYTSLGESEVAEVEFRKLLQDVEAIGNRPEKAFPRMEYAFLLLADQRPTEAESLLREALQILRRFYAERHTRIAMAEGLLGRSLYAQGLYPEAEMHFLHALEIFRALPPENEVHLKKGVLGMIEFYGRWGKPERAAEFQQTLAEMEQRASGQVFEPQKSIERTSARQHRQD